MLKDNWNYIITKSKINSCLQRPETKQFIAEHHLWPEDLWLRPCTSCCKSFTHFLIDIFRFVLVYVWNQICDESLFSSTYDELDYPIIISKNCYDIRKCILVILDTQYSKRVLRFRINSSNLEHLQASQLAKNFLVFFQMSRSLDFVYRLCASLHVWGNIAIKITFPI